MSLGHSADEFGEKTKIPTKEHFPFCSLKLENPTRECVNHIKVFRMLIKICNNTEMHLILSSSYHIILETTKSRLENSNSFFLKESKLHSLFSILHLNRWQLLLLQFFITKD